jgi:hypothetical protein
MKAWIDRNGYGLFFVGLLASLVVMGYTMRACGINPM